MMIHMASPPPFESSIGFLLSQLGVISTRSWLATLATRNLTPHHHAVLLTLHFNGPASITALSQVLLVDPRNMGPVLAPLEERGLVTRDNDAADRRKRIVSLTSAGSLAAGELAAATHEIENEILTPLTVLQRDALRSYLLALWQHTSGN